MGSRIHPWSFYDGVPAAEMVELYWMALCRDIPFTRYGSSQVIAAAVADLNKFKYFTTGPTYREAFGFTPEPSYPPGPAMTPGTIFRGFTASDQIGPWVSQFFLRDSPYGSQRISGAIRTLRAGVDFLTSYDDWLNVQNGCDANQSNCDDGEPKYIRNGRDIGQFVHVDIVFNVFLNATPQLS